MIKKRSEQEKQYTWATEDLYADDAAWEEAIKDAEKLPKQYEAYRGKLGESAQTLLSF